MPGRITTTEPGDQVGDLTAILPMPNESRHYGIVWLWRCKCGKMRRAIPARLREIYRRCGNVSCSSCRHRRSGVTRTKTLEDSYAPGATLRALRQKLGMTQAEAGELLGITKQAWHWYETGKTAVPARAMQILRQRAR